jgi:hypothetical protein
VDSGAGQQGGGVVVAGDAREVVSAGVADQAGSAGAHASGGQAVGVVRGDLAGRVGGPQGIGGVGGLHRQGAEEGGAVGGGGAVLVEDGVEYVDGRHVGELGNGDLGQLPGRLFDLKGGADAGGAVGDQGQAPPCLGGLQGRLVPLGDVHHQLGHPQNTALGVLKPVHRDRPGVLVLRVGRGAADDGGPVDQRHPGLKDLPHRGLGLLELCGRHDLAVAAAEVIGRGNAVDALQRGVD